MIQEEESSGLDSHVNRYALHPAGLLVDMAWPHHRVAVLAQGPEMYSIASKMPNGAALFKRRLTNALGWTTLDVPHWDWDQLGGDRELKAAYMRVRLGVGCSCAMLCKDCGVVMYRMATGQLTGVNA